MILVSACLAGFRCRYDGKASTSRTVMDLVEKGCAFPVCPEQLGGCPTPRTQAEIQGGTGIDVLKGKSTVKTIDGMDVTDKFIRGAEETLKMAKILGIKKAVLKSRSPSCGCGQIYDGSFSGRLRIGNGVAAQLLIDNGIIVVPA